MKNNKFTPTQQRMLDTLSDGRPHTRAELHACLADELGSTSNISSHLSEIRKALRPKGQDIVCQYYRRTFMYRWVRLLTRHYDE